MGMYKKWEYKQFLEFVQKRRPQRALIYAQTLGIDRRTLVKWMKQPELQEAMAEAVDEIVDQMQRAGKDDWRMWRDMLKMAGVDEKVNVDVTSGGSPIKDILGKYGLEDDEEDRE